MVKPFLWQDSSPTSSFRASFGKARSDRVSYLLEVYNQRNTASSRDKKTKIMASGPITSWQIDGETAG